MALKPILKNKVDELFLRWLSEPDTQSSLKDVLRQLANGEPLSQAALYMPSLTSPKSSSKQSSRLRPSSPPFSAPTTKLPSPRSPRRPLGNKNNHKSLNGNSKTNQNVPSITKDNQEIIPKDSSLDDINGNNDKNKENKKIPSQVTTGSPTIPTISATDSSKKDTKAKHKDTSLSKVKHINSANIPMFYFPYGKPLSNEENDKLLRNALQEISKFDGGKVHKNQMATITKACNVPLYWKALLFQAAGGDNQGYITKQSFTAMWKKVFQTCHDEAAQFVKLCSKSGSNYLQEDDFMTLIQDVVDTHPGLTFLQEAPEFHSRYVNTVIARIFYCVNRSWTGNITINELRKSNFLSTLAMLDQEDDINQITDFFSYEHFYVIYCKFWELDKDHDLFIDKSDLARHNDHAISSRVIDRIFSGAVTRGKTFKEARMSYPEFVWFLLSEEDKRHPTSIEYWFRCMDLDGDGVISMYEMEYFYDEQVQKMEALGIEKLPFEDCLCQMLDLVRPRNADQITLSDLKNCRMTNIFFDTFFNLDKFLEHEQRDPFANARDLESEGPEPTDWEKYAAEEYEILVAEEGANDQDDIILNKHAKKTARKSFKKRQYEDDFEPDDEEVGQEENKPELSDTLRRVDSPMLRNKTNMTSATTDDDIYDFSSNNLGY